jgi:hypothetical protein
MGCGVNKLIFGITGTEEPKKFPNKTWSKEAIKKKLEELSSKDAEGKYTEYVQYIVWYLSKRLNNP